MNTHDTHDDPGRRISEARLAANRANARKSTGPRTGEGKARSAMNALKHGFTAQVTLLPGESQEGFDQIVADYFDFYQPTNPQERSILEHLVTIEWQTRRIRSFEDALIEIESADPEIDRKFKTITGTYRHAVAYERLAQRGVLHLASRQLARLHREKTGLTQLLLELRRNSHFRAPSRPAATRRAAPGAGAGARARRHPKTKRRKTNPPRLRSNRPASSGSREPKSTSPPRLTAPRRRGLTPRLPGPTPYTRGRWPH